MIVQLATKKTILCYKEQCCQIVLFSIAIAATCTCLNLTNGVITYNPDTTVRLEGTVATHSCDVGYGLSGGTERTCQSNRRWRGGSITCEGNYLSEGSTSAILFFCSAVIPDIYNYTVIECSSLPAIENGTIAYSSDTTEPYDYGTTAMYQCDSGYELTGGDTVRTCTGDGSSSVGQWNGTAPNCTGTRFLVLMYAFPVLQFHNLQLSPATPHLILGMDLLWNQQE